MCPYLFRFFIALLIVFFCFVFSVEGNYTGNPIQKSHITFYTLATAVLIDQHHLIIYVNSSNTIHLTITTLLSVQSFIYMQTILNILLSAILKQMHKI